MIELDEDYELSDTSDGLFLTYQGKIFRFEDKAFREVEVIEAPEVSVKIGTVDDDPR